MGRGPGRGGKRARLDSNTPPRVRHSSKIDGLGHNPLDIRRFWHLRRVCLNFFLGFGSQKRTKIDHPRLVEATSKIYGPGHNPSDIHRFWHLRRVCLLLFLGFGSQRHQQINPVPPINLLKNSHAFRSSHHPPNKFACVPFLPSPS